MPHAVRELGNLPAWTLALDGGFSEESVFMSQSSFRFDAHIYITCDQKLQDFKIVPGEELGLLAEVKVNPLWRDEA